MQDEPPNQPQTHAHATASADPLPSFRSGAVARMAGMPVATLRIWEQRHQAVQPGTAASGHRLYSAADLQRVLWLRQLTTQGHAIGSIAPLSTAQLQQLAEAPSAGTGVTGRGAERPRSRMRLVVVGQALAVRLQRAPLLLALARPLTLVTVVDSLAEAAQAASAAGADLLLWHAPELQLGVPPELADARAAWHGLPVAVVYRFAGAAAIQALLDAGASVFREPPDDAAMGRWLAEIDTSLTAKRSASGRAPLPSSPWPPVTLPPGPLEPRRFDDATLTAIASLSPALACECPRHVAELLMQLSSFEAYSADCSHRGPADAQLHAYLQQVAGAARALFESALERVAQHEGLNLGAVVAP